MKNCDDKYGKIMVMIDVVVLIRKQDSLHDDDNTTYLLLLYLIFSFFSPAHTMKKHKNLTMFLSIFYSSTTYWFLCYL